MIYGDIWFTENMIYIYKIVRIFSLIKRIIFNVCYEVDKLNFFSTQNEIVLLKYTFVHIICLTCTNKATLIILSYKYIIISHNE